MAALTTAQEYESVREAVQELTATGSSLVSITIGGMTRQYAQNQLPMLERREKELLRRLTIRNARKRTTADFTGTGGSYLS